MEHEITEQKIRHYFKVAEKAISKVKIAAPEKTELYKIAGLFYDMARRYIKDAEYHYKKGDVVTAFASLNYAHGWLDAGASLGLWDVGHDSELFTVD